MKNITSCSIYSSCGFLNLMFQEENASITNSRLYNVALKAAKTISMWTSLVVELVRELT